MMKKDALKLLFPICTVKHFYRTAVSLLKALGNTMSHKIKKLGQQLLQFLAVFSTVKGCIRFPAILTNWK